MRSTVARAARQFVMSFVVFLAVLAVAGLADSGPSVAWLPIEKNDSIQRAIDAAPEGAVLALASGRYEENITIDKDLTLRGPTDGEARIVGAESGCVVRILGDGVDVRLQDLTVSGGLGFKGHGIQIEGAPIVEVFDVTLTDNDWCGIWATDRSAITLRNCELSRNGTFGIYQQDFANVRVESSAIRDNQIHGVFALHISELTVVDSQIRENWSGIWAWDGTRVYVENTVVGESTTSGIIASNAALIVLADSTVSDNGQYGLWFTESSRGVLSHSYVIGNGADGLFAQGDAILEINDCAFAANAGAGLRAGVPSCTGAFDAKTYFAGTVEGAGNAAPGPEQRDGNRDAALCPLHPGSLWPSGFLSGE
jgi:nitrous oxidase accessory protein NosD